MKNTWSQFSDQFRIKYKLFLFGLKDILRPGTGLIPKWTYLWFILMKRLAFQLKRLASAIPMSPMAVSPMASSSAQMSALQRNIPYLCLSKILPTHAMPLYSFTLLYFFS